jgi:hypothetical protein
MHKTTKNTNLRINSKKTKTNNKSSYEYLFAKFEYFISKKDWEMTHSYADDILDKFINEILTHKYKTKKQIYDMASLIHKKVLSKNIIRWYA